MTRLLALLFSSVVLSSSAPINLANLLQVGQPIAEADRHLQARGWRPAPELPPGGLDRERAGNHLASLSACSGAAVGYCRYDYRRDEKGRQTRLAVITWRAGSEPRAATGTGTVTGQIKATATVLRWSDEGPGGGRWGLCPAEAGQLPLPCESH